eukprot:CAMPEP_0119034432 /NCGR_PEP_ID=MMETSP1177-20130426/1418_1 /TAXON_ID=2985 /ORGANISM="Ochromonas sp, Strain CCMP1899" /LENGTH=870 /DNA_ID=CAMNT_0006991857 /DNA_START=320 /DNA_END=2929 /DNA_ORIENTATION=-
MANKGGELKNVLMKFSELSKVMAATADDSDGDEYETTVTTGDTNEFDYQYENNKNDTPQVAGGVSSEWIEEYYMKKRWESKEAEIRARKGETVEKQTDLHPGANSIKTELFSSGASSKALTSDLLHIIQKSDELGYTVTPVDDDIYNWTVKLHRVRQDAPLAVDLIMLEDAFEYSYIEFQLNFAMDLYPFYPPLCTITRPRFEGFMLGKIATLSCLQLTYWDPLFGTADIIENIRKELEDNGRIDHQSSLNCLVMHPEGSYTILEHLLLKLGTVTETPPRVQNTQELIGKNNGRSSGSKRKSQGDYDLDDPPPPSMSDPSVTSSLSTSTISGFGKPIFLPTIPLEVKQEGWAKGTGFGHGQRVQQWDIAQHTIAQVEKDRLLNHLLSQVLIEMKKIIDGRSTDDPSYFNRLQDVVEKSCLIPLLEAHVRNESFLDMENHYALYYVVFQVLEVFADCFTLQPLLLNLNAQKASLADLIVQKLGHRIDIYNRSSMKNPVKPENSLILGGFDMGTKVDSNSGKLEGDIAGDEPSVELGSDTIGEEPSIKLGGDITGEEPSAVTAIFDADGLMPYIQLVVEKVRSATTQALPINKSNLSSSISTNFSDMDMETGGGGGGGGGKSENGRIYGSSSSSSSSTYVHADSSSGSSSTYVRADSSSSSSTVSTSEEALYINTMRSLQYAESDHLSGYYYRNLLTTDNMGANLKKRIKRLGQEHSDLSQALPLSLSSSVWLRSSAERMDALQFMISGPEDTPYSNGLFLFDSFFPMDYPNSAPKVNLQTTGKGSVRFNPNLYNCGKVCLSLLGTWPGQKEESWDAYTSTFLQVLVSIQSLILVSDPYFNEPGYEATMHSKEGQDQSKAYNEKLREKTIKW